MHIQSKQQHYNKICFTCGGLVPEPNTTYGWGGKWCVCEEPVTRQTSATDIDVTRNPTPPTVSVEDWEQRFDKLIREMQMANAEHLGVKLNCQIYSPFYDEVMKRFFLEEIALAKQQERSHLRSEIEKLTKKYRNGKEENLKNFCPDCIYGEGCGCAVGDYNTAISDILAIIGN